MNNKLSEVISQIKSEISVNEEGKATFTIRATARICDVSMQTLSKQFTDISDNLTPSKLAETLIQSGFTPDNLKNFATTGIPDLAVAVIIEYYALDAGRYCTEQAKLVLKTFVAVGIRSWSQEIVNWKKEHTSSQDNDKLILKSVLDDMWSDISENFPEIDKRLIKGAKLNGYGRLFPELKGDVEEAKHLISATSSEESLPLSPTELGVKFAQEHCLTKVSAQKVNQALVFDGLQEKSGDKLCPYRLTSLGEEYGELQLETCKGHNKTVYRIRWYEEVMDVIEDTLTKLTKTKNVIKL